MFEVNPAKVKSLMFEQNMTIRALSQKAGLAELTTAKILRGSQSNARTIGKLAAALGVKGEELILEEGN